VLGDSAHAGAGPDAEQPEPPLAVAAKVATERRPSAALRFLDVVVVVVAAVPAMLLGAPVFGYVVGGGAWLLQRAIQATDRRWAARDRDPTSQVGVHIVEAFGRIWLLVGAIVLAGVVGGRADGLTAALVIFGAYSVSFAITLLSGQPEERAAR
jgi:hypothetical protein